MRNSKLFMMATIFICVLFLMSSFGISRTKIDVEKEVKQKINANPALIAKLIKRLFNEDVDGNDYKLTEFTITTMNQISSPEIDVTSLPENWVFVTAKEVINCTGDPVTKILSLTGTTTTSKSITKTMNFAYSYSGSVGLSILIVSGSATQTWSASYSQSWQDTETETYSATDQTNIQLNEKGGRVYTLVTKHLQGSIPYEAIYEIANNSFVTFKFVGKSGHIYAWTDANYSGNGNKYTMGTNISELESTMHDSISSLRVNGGVQGTLYQHKNYNGKSKTFTQDTNWVGNDFNDKASSLKVERRKFNTTDPLPLLVLFGQVKDLIPVSIRQFTAKGTIDIDYTYPVPVTRVIIKAMDPSYFNSTCETSSGGAVAGASGSGLKESTLTKAQYQRLLNSGKIK